MSAGPLSKLLRYSGVSYVLHIGLVVTKMMDDHDVLCRARHSLSDALRTLLNPNIMTATDFQQAKDQALAAIGHIDDLLRQSNRD